MTTTSDWVDIPRALAQAGPTATALAITLACGMIPLVFPQARRESVLLGLGVLATAALRREAILAVAAVGGLAYLIAHVISRLPPAVRPAAAAVSRWKLACGVMVGLAALFLALQWRREHPSATGERDHAGALLIALNLWTAIQLTTFFWEIGSGRVELPPVRRFCLWFFYPFTLQGPVIRLSDLEAQVGRIRESTDREPPRRWLIDAALALGQMVLGFSLAALEAPLTARGTAGKLAVLLVVAPWAFLFQAGGWLRSMEVYSRGWNVTLPPSFNRPFGRPNISEFWANWNMTVTSVFRDYIFYNRWGRRRPNIYVNSLILFVLVGAWHAANAYWLLWGFIHGIGFCVYLWYKQKGKALQPLFRGPRGRALAITLTYLYVVSAWALPPQLMKLSQLLR